jgi:16S rRNA (cytosine1402-N4)-methyltransferase
VPNSGEHRAQQGSRSLVSSVINAHAPVLLAEAVEGLAVRPGGNYIDATYGRGGHAQAILGRLGPAGTLLVVDRDPQAIGHAHAAHGRDPRVRIEQATFDRIGSFVAPLAVDGILFDLGVSSPQLDDPARGFSFMRDGPLDMRMDPTRGLSAADFIATAPAAEIARVIFEYGEDRFARRIAHAIETARATAPIATTAQLAELVARAVPTRERSKNPATRTFQALRMHVNGELELIGAALRAAVDVLSVGGRLAVISFHSLEDRLVKRFLRDAAQEDPVWRGLPGVPESALPKLALVGRAIRAGQAETDDNPRARSATLRIAERVRS